MFFMIGITDGQKELNVEQSVHCPSCGNYGFLRIWVSYYQLILFFLPIFRWGKRYTAELSCCGSVFELDPEVGRAIERGEAVRVGEKDLSLIRTGEEAPGRYCPWCGYPLNDEFEYCPKCGTKL